MRKILSVFVMLNDLALISKIMIFILLPILGNTQNVTGYDRTDIKGRFWEETYDCDDKSAHIVLMMCLCHFLKLLYS